MPMLCNYNGRIANAGEQTLPPDNSAMRYGNGLFETMLVKDGRIGLGNYHWERLFTGLLQLHYVVPVLFTPAMLESEVLRTVQKNNLLHLCRVRLQVFGGSGGIFGAEDNKLHYLIECHALHDTDLLPNENGLVTGIATSLNKSMDSLANLKSCNALIYAMAARQAKYNKWNDALVCNTAGNIAESVIANVFMVKEGVIYTPPLSEGCVAGVMRRHILATVPRIVQQPLTAAMLEAADEVFLTNAIKGIRWVRAMGAKVYGSEVTRQLFASLFPIR